MTIKHDDVYKLFINHVQTGNYATFEQLAIAMDCYLGGKKISEIKSHGNELHVKIY